MNYEDDRLPNGVKKYYNNKKESDQWAWYHRKNLGQTYYMQDVDALYGKMTFFKNAGKKLFAEYLPEPNNSSIIKKFAIVSFFDVKKNESAMNLMLKNQSISLAFYLYLSRIIGNAQKFNPKFFFVVGEESPWTLIEIDIFTGKKTGITATVNEKEKWFKQWHDLGITPLQHKLKKWLSSI